MTNEEHIEQLKKLRSFHNGSYGRSINKAIDALEQEPSTDAVSRQNVNTLIDELARAISDERCCISRGRSTATIMQDILDLPSVAPRPTGQWIEVDLDVWDCSECKEGSCSGNKTNFCPNCGADMREGEV